MLEKTTFLAPTCNCPKGLRRLLHFLTREASPRASAVLAQIVEICGEFSSRLKIEMTSGFRAS